MFAGGRLVGRVKERRAQAGVAALELSDHRFALADRQPGLAVVVEREDAGHLGGHRGRLAVAPKLAADDAVLALAQRDAGVPVQVVEAGGEAHHRLGRLRAPGLGAEAEPRQAPEVEWTLGDSSIVAISSAAYEAGRVRVVAACAHS
jgi:hypothetical protein